MDFAQFAVNFESSIYRCVNWKNGLRISRNLPKSGAFWLLGGVHGILAVSVCMNGTNFAAFTI